jgi:hypothetical protein
LTERPKTGRKEIRSFGLLFATLSVLAGAFLIWKGNQHFWIAFGIAGIFLLTGLFMPRVLGPFYRIWMRFAAILAWVNTRILLTVFFMVILTPIGLIMRLLGKDLLNQKFDRSAQSYWVKRPADRKDGASYEHLF